MPTRIFAITAARETVTLDNEGRAEVSFTVSNTGPKPIAGRAKLVPLGSAKAAWLNLDGEQERNFAKGEAHQLTVHIAVPPGTPVGKYSFRLNIISVENPDDEFTEGPSFSFEVKELTVAQAPARKFPWWIVAIAGVLVVGGGLITWLLIPQKIAVPDVIGIPVERVGKMLQGGRLRLRTEPKSAGEKPGIIVDQNPKHDERVAPGTIITAFVEPEAKILRGHGGKVEAVAISDRWVVTGSDDHTARLWNLNAKDPAANSVVLRGHEGPVTAVAISPDNHWLVTAGGDFTVLEEERPVTLGNTARLWDLSANDPAANPVELRQPVRGLAISPDNRWLAAGSPAIRTGDLKTNIDGTARLWDLSAKDPAASPVVLRGQGEPVSGVAISPDSHWLVIGGGSDNTARLWDLSAKDPAASPVVLNAGPKAPIWAVAITNRWVVTGSGNGTVRLWDLSAKDPAANPVVLNAGPKVLVTAVAISPDNHWVTAGSNSVVRLWDLSAKDPATNPVGLPGHVGWVTVAISPDSHWLVTNYDTDNTARLWDLNAKDPAANPVVLRGHEGPVSRLAISPDSRWLVTGSSDHTARLWDLGKPASF